MPIRALRRDLASALSRVQRGERVVVLRRGIPIAHIIPAGRVDPLENRLDALAARGFLRRASARARPPGAAFRGFDQLRGARLFDAVRKGRR
jgi:prevent-host-death family protein